MGKSEKKSIGTKGKDKPKAFVIMPITTPMNYYDDKNHFIQVYQHLFEPALNNAGFDAIPPNTNGSNLIHADIIYNLQSASLVLCDMSSLNPNVFFELGIRTALNKPVCMIKDNLTKETPFDAFLINHHIYNHTLNVSYIDSEKEKLTQHIKDTIKNTPQSNALWEKLGITYAAEPIESSNEQNIKVLQLENELLKSKTEKNIPSSVSVERGFVHRCSKCNFGMVVKDHPMQDSITRMFPSLDIKPTVVTAMMYSQPYASNLVKCPNCGNFDSI